MPRLARATPFVAWIRCRHSFAPFNQGFACPATTVERKRPLSDLCRGPDKAVVEIRREARECSRLPLHQYRRRKFIRFSTDDCFAAFCLVSRFWPKPLPRNAVYYSIFGHFPIEGSTREFQLSNLHRSNGVASQYRKHCAKRT